MLFLLRFLDLSNNKDLIGNIPTNIENLSRLKNLYLYNMQLTSTIPNSIGKLTRSYKAVSGKLILYKNALAPGVYLLTINANGKSIEKKIVVD